MKIAVIGASGGVGRAIAAQLMRDHMLEENETLQLVGGDAHSPHPHLLEGLRADILDAYSETASRIEVVNDLSAIDADIIVLAAGHTFATTPAQVAHASRDELAANNLPVFQRFAQAIGASKRSEPPLCIIVSNPVELGVRIFSDYLPREYVIGMGAHSDSLRFRAEIAHDLGVRRQRVWGYVVGEHGAGMVPLWSSVHVAGMSSLRLHATLQKRVGGIRTQDFPARAAEEVTQLVAMLQQEGVEGPARAYRHIATLAPELRVLLKPLATHYTEAKTILATAHATLDLIRWILHGRTVEVSVQYEHRGENGFSGPLGARVIVAGKVEQVLSLDGYSSAEMNLIHQSQENIANKIRQWCRPRIDDGS